MEAQVADRLSRLESLPLHLLLPIGEYVASCEPDRRSLFALSLTSRTCCVAADAERFRHVHITVRSPKQLRSDVQRWQIFLETGYRLRYVRSLHIYGQMRLPQPEDDAEDEPTESAWLSGMDFEKSQMNIIDDTHDWKHEISTYPKSLLFFNPSPLPSTDAEREEEDKAWLPLAQLCQSIPGLRDIVYACIDQIPRCLLSSIHADHPNSRLHMHTFCLRSFVYAADKPRPLDPHELAIIKSPCLASIAATPKSFRTETSTGIGADYNIEVALDMIRGLAPRLENVVFSHDPMDRTHISPMIPRTNWQGIPGQDTSVLPGGKVRRLFLTGLAWETAESLRNWGRLTDLRCLRSLDMQYRLQLDALTQLGHMALEGQLPCLETLNLNIEETSPPHIPQMDPAVANLLLALPPLRRLTLRGVVHDRAFDAILSHFGQSLRNLRFLPTHRAELTRWTLSPERARKLSQACRALEFLHTITPRIQSTMEEVGIYQCLGKLPKLQSVSLILDCQIVPLPYPEHEEELNRDRQNGIMHFFAVGRVSVDVIQTAFKDAAIDSNIALEIFRILSSANNLKYLKVRPSGWTPATNISKWMEWIGRPWVVERDFTGCITTVDLAAKSQVWKYLDDRGRLSNSPMRIMLEDAWNGLWPRQSKCWWTDWSGFPLADANGDAH